MKIIALAISMTLSGCVSLSFDISTKYGDFTFGTNGKTAAIGFKTES